MQATGKANHNCSVLEGVCLEQTWGSLCVCDNVLGLFLSTELQYSLRKEHALLKFSNKIDLHTLLGEINVRSGRGSNRCFQVTFPGKFLSLHPADSSLLPDVFDVSCLRFLFLQKYSLALDG